LITKGLRQAFQQGCFSLVITHKYEVKQQP
jgi:hypothetical protein